VANPQPQAASRATDPSKMCKGPCGYGRNWKGGAPRSATQLSI